MSIADKLTAVAENQQKVYDAGVQAEHDRFWNAYQSGGRRVNYLYAFAGLAWTDDTYDPIHPITASQNASCLFLYSRITDTKVTIDLSGSTQNTVTMFNNATKLKTIRKLIVSETVNMSGFQSCSALENLTVEGQIGTNVNLQWSPLLTNESVQSVIDHLADLTGADSKTLTLHADVKAALTQSQLDAVAAKNWVLV